MRIVCDSCGTKYSIPDDRVKNRPFKIRCKKCSYTIVVDGAESSAGAETEAIWYVVINGEQLGPVTPRDVEEYFYSQQIDLETYIWRDGFPDWIQLSAASEFAQLLNASPAAAAAPAAAMAAAGAVAAEQAPDGGYDEDEAIRQVNLDEFYAAGGVPADDGAGENDATRIVSMTTEPEPAAEAGSGFDSFGDLGSQLESQLDDNDPDEVGGLFSGGLADLGASAPAASSAAGPGNDLVGARSENSVLFSLSNLQAIGKPTASTGGDLPTTEGSGLIDIKALAASQAAAPADSRQSFGGGGGDAFDASVIPVPAMMPMGTRKSNTGLIIGISAGAVVLIGLIVTVIILALGGDDKEQTPQAKNDKEEEEQIEAPDLGVGGAQAGQVVAQNTVGQVPGVPGQVPPGGVAANGTVPVAGQPIAGQPIAGQPIAGQPVAGQAVAGQVAANAEGTPAEGEDTAAAEEEDDDNKSRRRRRRDRRSRRGGSDDSSSSSADAKPEKKPEKKPKADSGGSKRSKGEIMGVVKKNFGKIRTCSRNADKKGKMKVNFTIKGDGRTSGVSIGSADFKGTRVGACVVKVFQGMRFSDSGASQTIKNFPVAIN